jgi:hypothetical protein
MTTTTKQQQQNNNNKNLPFFWTNGTNKLCHEIIIPRVTAVELVRLWANRKVRYGHPKTQLPERNYRPN